MRSATISDKMLGLLTIICGLTMLTLGTYIVHAAFPFNAVHLPAETSVQARLWSPQGWRFFTRNAREERIMLFTRSSDGHWRPADIGPNISIKGWFGFSRAPRAQGIEYGGLLYGLRSKQDWSKCDIAPIEDCLERAPVDAATYNATPEPTLCGTVGFVRQAPVPWAWSTEGNKFMPSRVLKMYVKC